MEKGQAMTKFRAWLKGKKTYLSAAGVVIATAIAWADGDVGAWPAVMVILSACGLGSFRAALSKIEKTFSGN